MQPAHIFMFFCDIFINSSYRLDGSTLTEGLIRCMAFVVYIYDSFAEKQTALWANGVDVFGPYFNAKKVYIDP